MKKITFLSLMSLLFILSPQAYGLELEITESAMEIAWETSTSNLNNIQLIGDYTYNWKHYFTKKIDIEAPDNLETLILWEIDSSSYFYTGNIISKDNVLLLDTFENEIPDELIMDASNLSFSEWSYGYTYIYVFQEYDDTQYIIIWTSAYIGANYGETEAQRKINFMTTNYSKTDGWVDVWGIVRKRLIEIQETMSEEKYQEFLKKIVEKVIPYELNAQKALEKLMVKINNEEDFEMYKNEFNELNDAKTTYTTILSTLRSEIKTSKVNSFIDSIFQ